MSHFGAASTRAALTVALMAAIMVAAPLSVGCGSTTVDGNGAPAGAPGNDPNATDSPGGGGDNGLASADAEIARWVADETIPGAVLVVSRGGAVIFERAYGYAQLFTYDRGSYEAVASGMSRPDAIRRLDEPVAMRIDTVFDLASVTKMMATTFGVMLLVDEGRLDLDAPVREYLPDFGATAGAPAGKSQITIRQLLTHRSGLAQWQPIYYHAADAEGAYGFIRDFPLAWAPGAERHYSDLGFMLLGLVVERISGQPLGDFVGDRLYEPLGLTTIGFRPTAVAAATTSRGLGAVRGGLAGAFAATSHGNPFEHRMVHDPDFGYRIDGDPDAWDGWRHYTLVGEVNDGNAHHAFGGEAGHAGLFAGAHDLGVLLQLLVDRGAFGGRQIVSTTVVDEFLADTGEGQALGWLLADYLPDGSFYHTGFTGTYVAGIPARNVTVVLLTNRQNVGVDQEGGYPNIAELQRVVAEAAAGDGR